MIRAILIILLLILSSVKAAGESLDTIHSLKEVEVKGVHRSYGVNSSQASAVDIPVSAVSSMPAIFGEADVIKTLQKIPGVSQGAEGKSGLYVRGGDYDQNMLLLDGATIFSSEHLGGYVSTINTDMLDGITLYKGAFPARYGGRLSSIVDMGLRNGSLDSYRGGVTLGVLSSKVQSEGPIWRGHTSFNIAARASYFDFIALPLLKKVSDHDKETNSYANMDFYDVTLRLAHVTDRGDRFTLTGFYGHDTNNSTPSNSVYESDETSGSERSVVNTVLEDGLENRWSTALASLRWDRALSKELSMSTLLNYTSYDYLLTTYSFQKLERSNYHNADDGNSSLLMQMLYSEDVNSSFRSSVDIITFSSNFSLRKRFHDIKWGVNVSYNKISPQIQTFRHRDLLMTGASNDQTHENFNKENVLGETSNQTECAAYLEDDLTISRSLKANIGLRYSIYGVYGRTYSVLEPRLSMRWLIDDAIALKGSFARMSQGIHQLVSSNLVNPSDIWVPTTARIKPMTADQIALAVNYQPHKWLELSFEGYYKHMSNLLEYREGASFLSMKDSWERLVAMGDGQAYGVELLAQKRSGNLTGWIGYCWSKAFRKFDRPGQEINGGKRFYANNDRRNNINILLCYRLNNHWEVNASWSYLTGRCGNIAVVGTYGGLQDEINPVFDISKIISNGPLADTNGGSFVKFVQFLTYSQRNWYRLPSEHHMDIGINYSFKVKCLVNTVNLSIYNVYNHMNISNVFIGYDENCRPVLKGVCKLPFMPSISYSLKF